MTKNIFVIFKLTFPIFLTVHPHRWNVRFHKQILGKCCWSVSEWKLAAPRTCRKYGAEPSWESRAREDLQNQTSQAAVKINNPFKQRALAYYCNQIKKLNQKILSNWQTAQLKLCSACIYRYWSYLYIGSLGSIGNRSTKRGPSKISKRTGNTRILLWTS